MLNISSVWIERLLAQGSQCEAAGRLEEAEGFYEEALKIAPGNVAGLFLWGSVLFRKGEMRGAVAMLERAVRGRDDFAEGWSRLGLGLVRGGRLEDAEAALRKAVELEPENGGIWSNLGIVLKGQGRLAEAVACYREAVRLSPDLADGWNNLGNALRSQAVFAEAEGAFREALKLAPEHAETWSNLGIVLGELGRGTEAVEALEEAVRLNPEKGEFWENLGEQLGEMRQVEEAVGACRKAVVLGTPYPAAHLRLGTLLAEKGELEEGRAVLREGIMRFPEVAELKFELARMEGEKLRQLPTEMVRGLFEKYAPGYEEHLVKALKYRGPAVLMEAVLAVGGMGVEGPVDILDAGCGTGLVGEYFKGMAKTMVGVDLAEGMVVRARERGIYAEVVCGELAAVMRERVGAFDLVLAGDVFNYIGELEEVMMAARGALREGGYLAFTVEKAEAEVELLQTKRFGHSIGYVREVSGQCGFVEVYAAERVLREEKEKGLVGWVVVLRKGD